MAEFKDLLLKIANNQQLSPFELDELGRFGTESQQRNSLVSKWEKENFTDKDPTLMQLDFRTLGAKVRMDTDTAIATGTYTYFPWETVDYYDANMVNLASSNTKIFIPRTGRYVVGVNFSFEAITTSYWRVDIVVNKNTTPQLSSVIQNHPYSFGTLNISEDALLTIGDYIEARVLQTTGSDKNVLGANMYVRWLGVN